GRRALAGGTDLLTLIKAEIAAPDELINVKPLLPRGIEALPAGLEIGALTTLAEVEAHPVVNQGYAALAQAISAAATPQIRNLATVGGNLLQRPRCWYYRNARIDCWLKGGADCPAHEGENRNHALFGGGPCYAVHPSDLAPALVAFDGALRVHGRHGERAVELADFFALPSAERRRETTLAPDELILGLRLPPHPPETRSTYLKAMDRKTWSFALVGVACVVRLSGRKIAHARLVLSGVAPIPWRAEAAEHALLGGEASEDRFAAAAEAAVQGVAPLRHNAYKVPLTKALVRQALKALTDPACK
ncbi:MAG: xanthine dehydrogenase family protein subunit M, partial [Burkholderiales bacterium]